MPQHQLPFHLMNPKRTQFGTTLPRLMTSLALYLISSHHMISLWSRNGFCTYMDIQQETMCSEDSKKHRAVTASVLTDWSTYLIPLQPRLYVEVTPSSMGHLEDIRFHFIFHFHSSFSHSGFFLQSTWTMWQRDARIPTNHDAALVLSLSTTRRRWRHMKKNDESTEKDTSRTDD